MSKTYLKSDYFNGGGSSRVTATAHRHMAAHQFWCGSQALLLGFFVVMVVMHIL